MFMVWVIKVDKDNYLMLLNVNINFVKKHFLFFFKEKNIFFEIENKTKYF
jgi:hypothetical protein